MAINGRYLQQAGLEAGLLAGASDLIQHDLALYIVQFMYRGWVLPSQDLNALMLELVIKFLQLPPFG